MSAALVRHHQQFYDWAEYLAQVIFLSLFSLSTPQVHCAAAAVQQSGESGDGFSGLASHHAFRGWRTRELPDGLHASGQAAHHQWADAQRTHASSGNASSLYSATRGRIIDRHRCTHQMRHALHKVWPLPVSASIH